ncbi:MAG: MlaD family protein [Candidatus Scalindua rubra]|uniref:Paraquat-inducible protein B n=1 Tax=Candidatus Scalindua brodae TaxID=237368 RepID=A0A0B0EB06_9BACT|nr:MAG: Paraquat-inducible protein B [Candidatus Scalindua brodae]MBZ0109584.1 MlaD family protein [Candidatus Scalindua rubra]TWU33162.1 Paraquat-inducible protein B [Candidatus Brocadiaceae bacterium S225]
MSAKANFFKIGIFVISATIIAIIAIVVLGVGTLFKKKIFFETYIEGSVQGLDVGSPVKMRGVPMGNVEEIAFVREKYKFDVSSEEDLNYGQYVFIQLSVEPKMEATEKEQLQFLVNMIAKGLRIRLASQGITGGAYLEADFLDPEKHPPMKLAWEPGSHYIPSAPSTITQFTESVEKILEKLEELNVKGITDGLEKTLVSVNKILNDTKVTKIAEHAEQLLLELSDTNKRLKPVLSDVSVTMATVQRITRDTEKPLSQSLGELPEIITKLKYTLRRLDNFVSREEQDMEISTENLRLITGNLQYLTENAKQYPSFLLFGKPPPHSYPGGKQQ